MTEKSLWGRDALHRAAMKNDVDTIRERLVAGIDVNLAEQRERFQPLHFAVQEGSVDAARVLLDAGADLHARIGGGKTPLHYAVVTWYASPDGAMIKLLLDRGADRTATAVDGETPAEFADGMWEFPPDLRALLEP